MSSAFAKVEGIHFRRERYACLPVWAEQCYTENYHHFLPFRWCGFKVSCSLSWGQQVLVASFVIDVSGNDVVLERIFFFSLNLKGFIFKRGIDCTFLHLRIFSVVNIRIHCIPKRR